jgi:hypothetical protein
LVFADELGGSISTVAHPETNKVAASISAEIVFMVRIESWTALMASRFCVYLDDKFQCI